MFVGAHVACCEDRVVVMHEVEDLAHHRQEVAVVVDDPQSRPGVALPGPASVQPILMARDRRQPNDLGAQPERVLDGERVQAAGLVVEGDAAEHGDVRRRWQHRPHGLRTMASERRRFGRVR